MCEQAVEFLYTQLRDPSLWRTNVLTSFNSVISVSQRLAIPGERENVVVVGSDDSAKHLLAVFNYTAKECCVLVWTKEVVDAVTVALVETGVSAELLGGMIISVQERARDSLGVGRPDDILTSKVFVNANANNNTVRWVASRVAHNPFAQHILLILGWLEWRHLIYLNTKRN